MGLCAGMEQVHEEVLFELKQYGHILSPEEAEEMKKSGKAHHNTEMAQMSKSDFQNDT